MSRSSRCRTRCSCTSLRSTLTLLHGLCSLSLSLIHSLSFSNLLLSQPPSHTASFSLSLFPIVPLTHPPTHTHTHTPPYSNRRQRHASMVHRMLGMKMGTGGSSGYNYLKATATHHKVFADFSSLSMFLIPRSSLPRLPKSIEQRLRFHYSDIKGKTDDDTDSVFN